MKIAVSAENTDLEAKVAHKFGTSKYLVIVDLDSGDSEAVPNPDASAQRGAGMQAVVLAISRDVEVVLTGYCSPAAKSHLTVNGIEVISDLSGTIGEVVERYKKGDLGKHKEGEPGHRPRWAKIDKVVFNHAIRTSANQFATLLPILVSIVLLMGLFSAFVPRDFLVSIFSGNPALDTLWGACFGSILAGNPINSYIIGGELLTYGLSLLAVTAFIITWVTVGLIQLPAEIAALGKRFALVRNAVSFVLAIGVATLTVLIFNFVTG